MCWLHQNYGFLRSFQLQRFRENLRPNEDWGPHDKNATEDHKESEMIDSVKRNGKTMWNRNNFGKDGIRNEAFEDPNITPPLFMTKL